MQDRILNPITTEEAILVIRLRNQNFDAELLLREKMKPGRLAPIGVPFDGKVSTERVN